MMVEGADYHKHLILDKHQGTCALQPPGHQTAQSLLLTRAWIKE